MTRKNLAAALLAAALAVGGATAAAGEYSGFLDGYPDLETVEGAPGVEGWENPAYDPSRYQRVMLDPVIIYLHPDSEDKGIDADTMKAVSDGLHQALVEVLEPAYPVVTHPNDATVQVRIAVTGVKMKKKSRGLLGYTPIGFVVTAAQDAAGKRIELDEAGLEIEVLDANTGERQLVAVMADALKGDDGRKAGSWDAVEARLKALAERFRARLEAAQR